MTRPCEARIWRTARGSGWWAEVWAPTARTRPPRTTPHSGHPPAVPGMERVGCAFTMTRRGARRAARRMKARYESGLPCDRPAESATVEIIQ